MRGELLGQEEKVTCVAVVCAEHDVDCVLRDRVVDPLNKGGEDNTSLVGILH